MLRCANHLPTFGNSAPSFKLPPLPQVLTFKFHAQNLDWLFTLLWGLAWTVSFSLCFWWETMECRLKLKRSFGYEGDWFHPHPGDLYPFGIHRICLKERKKPS